MSSADVAALTRPKDRLRRRRVVNRVMESLMWLSAAIAVAILVIVVYSVARRGAPALSIDFLTKPYIPFAPPGTSVGLANAFVGTIVIVGVATLMALPIGILVALYVNEFAPRAIKNLVILVLDILVGIPAIVIGLFILGLVVLHYRQSGIAGSIALGIMMLPLVARSTIEVLALVPSSLREASLGLGVPRWRTTLGIVLPQSVGGILTGSMLAVARVAGETAPLLLLSSIVGNTTSWNPFQALWSVPLAIYELSESPDQADIARAWAAAFVLLMFILVTSLTARWLATRSRRKLGQVK